MGVFDKYIDKVYPYRWKVTLLVDEIHGGIPTDPKVAEGWIKTFLQPKEEIVQELVAKTLVERGVTTGTADLKEVIEDVIKASQLNGFYRNAEGGLAIAGRHVKAMIKENANIAWPKKRWGPSGKGTKSYFAEHVFIPEKIIPLGVTEPDGIDQRFVHTWRGAGIQYEEFVRDAEVTFTMFSDFDMPQKEWAQLWLRAQNNGLGAARSQGYGTFDTIGFDKIAA